MLINNSAVGVDTVRGIPEALRHAVQEPNRCRPEAGESADPIQEPASRCIGASARRCAGDAFLEFAGIALGGVDISSSSLAKSFSSMTSRTSEAT